MCNLNKSLQQILILYSFVLLNKFSCRCYDTKYACTTYWKNVNDFLIGCYYNLPHEMTLEILDHPVVPSFTALVPFVKKFMAKGDLQYQKTTSESGFGEKPSS